MTAVHRVDVRPKPGMRDPRGERVLRQAESVGLPRPAHAEHAAVYLVEGDLTAAQVQAIAGSLLADPVTQVAEVTAPGARPAVRAPARPPRAHQASACLTVSALIGSPAPCPLPSPPPHCYSFCPSPESGKYSLAETK